MIVMRTEDTPEGSPLPSLKPSSHHTVSRCNALYIGTFHRRILRNQIGFPIAASEGEAAASSDDTSRQLNRAYLLLHWVDDRSQRWLMFCSCIRACNWQLSASASVTDSRKVPLTEREDLMGVPKCVV